MLLCLMHRYREAELKHGRLAMVALAGWPVATLVLALLTGVGETVMVSTASRRCLFFLLLWGLRFSTEECLAGLG